jgi:hypothetical protein
VASNKRTRDSIPYGTLDMLILKTLSAAKEMHGFQIADYIQQAKGINRSHRQHVNSDWLKYE